MIVLRCTARLLKRLRQPGKLPEPPPSANPLGEWYADVDSFDRMPHALLLNAATGAMLLLPARAEHLRDLHFFAGQQLFKLFAHYGFDLDASLAGAELRAWDASPTFANTRDRSLVGTLNRLRFEVWHQFAQARRSPLETAAIHWDGLFRHPSLVLPDNRDGYGRPLDLLRARLMPDAAVQSATRVLQ